MGRLGPRLVVAGTASGVGKTTVATGLMAALRQRGHVVAAAKVGPDFIDPGYHALATGRPPRNLDSWICGEAAIGPLAGRAAAGADLLVVEGVMGLFDGAATDGPEASTASIARLLGAPVVLVVDAGAMARSVAALVHGYATFDPAVAIGGVILNRVGSAAHEDVLRRALEPIGIPVLGALARDDAWTWRDRHLGLVPVVEHPEEVAAALDRVAAGIAADVDLDAVVRLARRAPDVAVGDPPVAVRGGEARVAVAGGPGFSFVYQDNLEALAAAGAELLPFDPLEAPALPAGAQGLYAGGGFPEVMAEALAANAPLLADVRARRPVTWAECGGALWLARSLDGHPMAGLVDADAHMTGRLTLGYRTATSAVDNPLAAAGDELRGHEFHHSTLTPPGDALVLRRRGSTVVGGHASPSLLASYLHLHLGGDPAPATRFVATSTRR
jgi:cobyrinic acid a,c-diamide synthase